MDRIEISQRLNRPRPRSIWFRATPLLEAAAAEVYPHSVGKRPSNGCESDALETGELDPDELEAEPDPWDEGSDDED